MSKFPHTRLFLGPSRTVVISGPHIQVLNTATGDVLHSTADFDERDGLLKSGPVRCAAISSSNEYIATVGDDKILKVWKVDGLKLSSQRELPKKPTSIQFTQDCQTIVVSDKFGDIFSYALHPETTLTSAEKAKRDAFSSHENPSGGQLILGHASLLNAFLLTPDERYIVTADRDEHIRISWYPQGYNIERYCLGHKKFVSTIHIPTFSPSTLVSGGGDPVIKLWDWMSGTVQHEITILEAVEPFIKVRSKRGRYSDDDDGEEGAEGAKGKGKGKRKRGKGGEKGKAASKDKEQPGEAAEMSDSKEQGGSIEGATTGIMEGGEGAGSDIKEGTVTGNIVLVLHKVHSLESEYGRYILFSAVGATALFSCTFPEGDGATKPAKIISFDFGKPVIDFVLGNEGLAWILLDAEWSEKGFEGGTDAGGMVKIVKWTGAEFAEVDSGSTPSLLQSLNSTCLLPANNSDLDTLDIYSPLTSMPKNTDAEHNHMERDVSEMQLDDDGISDGRAGTPQGKQPTKRQLGRLKNKKALLKQMQEKDSDTIVGGEGDAERENKRTKSESEGLPADVAMAES